MHIKHKQVKENCVQKLVKDQIQTVFPTCSQSCLYTSWEGL